MERQTILAVLLSLTVLIGYQLLIAHLYPPPPPGTPPFSEPSATNPTERKPLIPTPTESLTPPVDNTIVPPPPPSAVTSAREFTVETDVYTATLTSLGGTLKSLRLKQYPGDEGRNSPPREMIHPGGNGELPLEVRLEGKGIALSDAGVSYQTSTGSTVTVQGDEQATIEFRGTASTGTTITKRLTFTGKTYGITLETKIENAPQNVSLLSVMWNHALDQKKAADSYVTHGPVALIGRKFLYEVATDLVTNEQQYGPDNIRWAGYADTYFLSAIIPPEGETHALLMSAKAGTVATKLAIPWNPQTVTYTVYIGPKEFSALNAVHPSLDRAIDFGWSHFIARPLLSFLNLLHSLTGNYGIDIILLTVLVKLAFFPLSIKSFKSMAAMRELQPQLEQLRAQYQDNRESLNRETMEMYRRHKINPLGGCLPLLIQLPVFIGLYQALMMAIELRQAPFFSWIQDLSSPDRLGAFVVPFVDPPGVPVLTILMGATMIMQQAMTPMPGDPIQQKMMMIMPLIFTVMFVNFPAGLVLYWLVNNVLSITQQYAYNKGLV
ncbi:MAG: membrane protein insertase YidC [Deltaproteobacteria bacterium]|nr:membrane protein insertase YidC [Deltaproteobacteria bacterium]